MSDKEKTKVEENAEEAKDGSKKSGGLMKYIMLGGGALVVVVAVSFLTLMVLKDEPVAHEPEEEGDATAHVDKSTEEHDEKHGKEQGEEHGEKHAEEGADPDDSLFFDDDPSVLAEIESNLAFLDYQPEESEIATETEAMSVEDSIEAVNWLEAEKTRLAEMEKELNSRQKELELLDKQVTKKINTIEQAESVRIQKLAKLYDGMEPRSVAMLLANLDNETVVSILPRMKTKNASAALSLLPAKRGAVLSKKMITIAEN